MRNATLSRNEKICLFVRCIPTRKINREIKRSHKVNANSNSAPSQACVRTDDTYLYTLSSDIYMRYNWQWVFWNPTDAPTSRIALSLLKTFDSLFPFYYFLVLSFLSVRNKDLLRSFCDIASQFYHPILFSISNIFTITFYNLL